MYSWLRQDLEKYVMLTDEEWDFLKNCGKTLILKPTESFLNSGAIANKVGFLKEGVLRAYQENNKGDIVTSYFYYLPHKNIVTLQTSYSLKIPSDNCIEAITECEIFYFDRIDIDNCLSNYSIFETLLRKIAEKQYLDSSKRINDFQTKDAKGKYNEFLNESGDLALIVPQYMIASYLGMSQYTLSKIK